MLQSEVPGKVSSYMDKIPLYLSAFVFNVVNLPQFSAVDLLLISCFQEVKSLSAKYAKLRNDFICLGMS